MQLDQYRQIQFVAGPFKGLLGRTLSPVNSEDENSSWYVEVMIAGRPVVREVPAADVQHTR